MRQNKSDLRRAVDDAYVPPVKVARVAARARWNDPASLTPGIIVQMRLGNGDIVDGARDVSTGNDQWWVWVAGGRTRKVSSIMGWLPFAGAMKPLPAVETLSITEVVDQVFSGLRTLRNTPGSIWPAAYRSAMPATLMMTVG